MKDLYPKFKEKLKPGNWEYNGNENTFKIKRGSHNWVQIVIKSQEAGLASFESAKVFRLGFDEQPWEETFNSCLIRGLDTEAQVLMAATMWEEGISWVNDRFIEPVLNGERNDVEFVGGEMTDNPMLKRSFIEARFKEMSMKNPEEALVRIKGMRISLSGKSVFSPTSLQMYDDQVEEVSEMEFVQQN